LRDHPNDDTPTYRKRATCDTRVNVGALLAAPKSIVTTPVGALLAAPKPIVTAPVGALLAAPGPTTKSRAQQAAPLHDLGPYKTGRSKQRPYRIRHRVHHEHLAASDAKLRDHYFLQSRTQAT
jgi:hypothetical protein